MSQHISIENVPEYARAASTETASEEERLALEQTQRMIRARSRATSDLRREVLADAAPQIIAAGQAVARAFARQATLLAVGGNVNAPAAQTLVSHLLQPPFPHWRSLPALVLPACSPPSRSGDEAEDEFRLAHLVSLFGHCGDIVLAFSSPSCEKRINAALVQAKRQEMLTIALVDAESSLLHAPALDFGFALPAKQHLHMQEMQATLIHTLLEIVHACVESRPPTRTRRSAMPPRVRRPFALDIH